MGGPDVTETIANGSLEGFRVRRALLRVVRGPDLDRRLGLRPSGAVIGRGQDADLQLSDPGVSRRHLRISQEEDGWRFEDLESKSGILVDGVRVKAGVLRPGAKLQVGETVLQFQVEEVSVGAGRDHGRGLLGESPDFLRCLELCRKIGGRELPVLLRGETGTGKEGLARLVHESSARGAGPYQVVDCTQLDREHLRSELAGHVQGAFTGARGARKGAFQRAAGGTLFLDEVGELPVDLQPMLLRALEQGEVVPLGGDAPVAVDVRLVSATHQDLTELVAEGRFREDLYYRICGVTVDVPPLRDRGGDAWLLATSFLDPGYAFAPSCRDALESYPWPGNVRELRHVVARAMAVCEGTRILPEDLLLEAAAAGISRPGPRGPPPPAGAPADDERRALLDALEAHRWNRGETARALGIDRTTLWRRMKKLGLL